MNTRELIKYLQELDPSGELEVVKRSRVETTCHYDRPDTPDNLAKLVVLDKGHDSVWWPASQKHWGTKAVMFG